MNGEQLWRGIRQDYQKGLIDYSASYLLLYAAYDRWCMSVTGASTMSDALEEVGRQSGLWRYFIDDEHCLMRDHWKKLYILTTLAPVPFPRAGRHGVRLEDAFDWRGVILVWYALRCLIVHGSHDYRLLEAILPHAHASLALFMARVLCLHYGYQVEARP